MADSRIRMYEDYALIDSSDRSKTYEVSWKDDVYASSDNATYWQGYPGYPVIAVLILQGKLPCKRSVCTAMKGIPWHVLNDKYQRDYAAAAEEAMRDIPDRDSIVREAENIHECLKTLDIEVGRGRKRKG